MPEDRVLPGRPPFEVETREEAETRALGRALASFLEPGRVVLLRGRLGAGKTVLCRGIAEGLGVDPRRVRSPSFNLHLTYPGRMPVHHIDLFRLEEGVEIVSAGIEEALWDEEAISLVEWGERLGGMQIPPGLDIVLEGTGGQPRTIRVALLPGEPEIGRPTHGSRDASSTFRTSDPLDKELDHESP